MLTHLSAREFRNFAHLDVAVPAHGLVVVGENGHGKTNLLEATAYLSLLRSMRGARDADMIRFGAPAMHVRAELSSSSAVQSVSVGYERSTKKKKVVLDGVEQSRLTSALGALPSVGFSPADVALVAGSPAERRRYLDVALALSSREYLAALQHFRAALARRNAVLRQAQRDLPRAATFTEQLRVWEPALAAQGAMVTAIRQQFVHGHGARFAELGVAIGEARPVTIRYVVSSIVADREQAPLDRPRAELVAFYEEQFLRAFAQHRAQEMRRGATLVGPHRDELSLLLGGRELRTFGSAGQQRSAAIALRLLELATLRESLGASPLLLLDDPFAELDLRRAARVLRLLEDQGIEQVLLAVPRTEDIPDAFTRLDRRTMHEGRLT